LKIAVTYPGLKKSGGRQFAFWGSKTARTTTTVITTKACCIVELIVNIHVCKHTIEPGFHNMRIPLREKRNSKL
jgi:hypothetical protein